MCRFFLFCFCKNNPIFIFELMIIIHHFLKINRYFYRFIIYFFDPVVLAFNRLFYCQIKVGF